VPEVAFCKDKFTVPPGATVAEDVMVFPGAGVPEQGVEALQAKRMFGLLVVEVPEDVVEEQTVALSALKNRDHVPVPRPVVVH
jgi:hypothetical protein